MSDDLTLTPQQAAYVENRLAGMSKSAAYRAAYKPKTKRAETIYVQAWKVEASPKVRQRLAAAVAARAEEATLTRTEHVARLEALQERAIAEGDLKAALRAEELIGRAMGLYVERVQHIEEDDPAKLRAELDRLQGARHGQSPDTRH